ncbi:hypothetical protein GW17_00007723 [Ensete ventricosum]|nr:hypothetical protein GW17_00007723 [Ensete ventricosum]
MAPCSYGGIRPPLHLHTRIHCVPLDSRRRCALDNEVPALLRLFCAPTPPNTLSHSPSTFTRGGVSRQLYARYPCGPKDRVPFLVSSCGWILSHRILRGPLHVVLVVCWALMRKATWLRYRKEETRASNHCGCSAYERAPASVGVGGKPLQLPRGCPAPHPDLSPSTGTWLSSGWPAG